MRTRRGSFPRRWQLVLAAVLGAAIAVLPTVASSETSPTIEAVNTQTGTGAYLEEHHRWEPPQATVMAGGVVTFSNPTEVPHGVEWRSALKPSCASSVPVGSTPTASGTKWSGTCTFSQAGTYTFYCTVHGPEMSGTITVNANGTTTTTTTTTPTTGTTPTTPPPTSKESPLAGPISQALKLPTRQRGGAVHGTLGVSRAGVGARLEIDLFAQSASLAKAKRSVRVRVGRLLRNSLSAGRLTFSVKLNASARRAVKRHRRLALTVKIVLTPPGGKSLAITRGVIEHA